MLDSWWADYRMGTGRFDGTAAVIETVLITVRIIVDVQVAAIVTLTTTTIN
jgi:hypothetical protein